MTLHAENTNSFTFKLPQPTQFSKAAGYKTECRNPLRFAQQHGEPGPGVTNTAPPTTALKAESSEEMPMRNHRRCRKNEGRDARTPAPCPRSEDSGGWTRQHHLQPPSLSTPPVTLSAEMGKLALKSLWNSKGTKRPEQTGRERVKPEAPVSQGPAGSRPQEMGTRHPGWTGRPRSHPRAHAAVVGARRLATGRLPAGNQLSTQGAPRGRRKLDPDVVRMREWTENASEART